MREAARRRSMYVIVPADPLADVAASWQQMWDPAGGLPGAAGFEASAAEALAAWRAKQFELPDYYLVVAPAQGSVTSPDLYLGPLRAVRPRRVAVAGLANSTVRPGSPVLARQRRLAPPAVRRRSVSGGPVHTRRRRAVVQPAGCAPVPATWPLVAAAR